MGIGFTAALLLMSGIRELLGNGTLLGYAITAGRIEPMIVMILPPGGFFVFGVLVAFANKLAVRAGKPPVTDAGCAACPAAGACKMSSGAGAGETLEKAGEA